MVGVLVAMRSGWVVAEWITVRWTMLPVGVATECWRTIPAARGDVGSCERCALSRVLPARRSVSDGRCVSATCDAPALFLAVNFSLSLMLPDMYIY